MSVINPLAREVAAKIVFYGPGLSGKTTTLAHIHSALHPTRRGELVSLATEGERTLFFDFLPIHMPRAQGLDVRLQLYTVPGQVFYGATRQLVLDGADGVVFVADSQEAAHERNLESFDDLEQNLNAAGRSLSALPHVVQYNKRDLPKVLDVEQLRADLNPHGTLDFETCASSGEGVDDVLRGIIRLVGRALSEEEGKARQRAELGQRLVFDPNRLVPSSRSERSMSSSEVGHAIASLVPVDEPPPLSRGFLVRPATSAPPAGPASLAEELDADLSNDELGDEDAIDEELEEEEVPQRDVRTMPAPPASTMSFTALWDEPELVRAIEAEIASGHFAEAVHRAASGVSEILDGLLGPHVAEGSGTRAQLLGLDGREYIELRRLASRPATSITQKDALFAFYLLVAARVKQSRLARY